MEIFEAIYNEAVVAKAKKSSKITDVDVEKLKNAYDPNKFEPLDAPYSPDLFSADLKVELISPADEKGNIEKNTFDSVLEAANAIYDDDVYYKKDGIGASRIKGIDGSKEKSEVIKCICEAIMQAATGWDKGRGEDPKLRRTCCGGIQVNLHNPEVLKDFGEWYNIYVTYHNYRNDTNAVINARKIAKKIKQKTASEDIFLKINYHIRLANGIKENGDIDKGKDKNKLLANLSNDRIQVSKIVDFFNDKINDDTIEDDEVDNLLKSTMDAEELLAKVKDAESIVLESIEKDRLAREKARKEAQEKEEAAYKANIEQIVNLARTFKPNYISTKNRAKVINVLNSLLWYYNIELGKSGRTEKYPLNVDTGYGVPMDYHTGRILVLSDAFKKMLRANKLNRDGEFLKNNYDTDKIIEYIEQVRKIDELANSLNINGSHNEIISAITNSIPSDDLYRRFNANTANNRYAKRFEAIYNMAEKARLIESNSDFDEDNYYYKEEYGHNIECANCGMELDAESDNYINGEHFCPSCAKREQD